MSVKLGDSFLMRKNFSLLLGLLCLLVMPLYSQRGIEKKKMEEEARFLVATGKIEDAVNLYRHLALRFGKPDHYYFLAAKTWYDAGLFVKAATELRAFFEVFHGRSEHYQLLGNCLDNLGNPVDAIEIYKLGLSRFPDSGPLYMELGILFATEGDTISAPGWWERGIEMAPNFSSNYYLAAKEYATSSELIRSVMYGEIFLLLEPNSPRTQEMSDSLFAWYKRALTDSISFYNGNFFSKDAELIFEKYRKGEDIGNEIESRFNLAWYVAWPMGQAFSVSAFHKARLEFLGFWGSANKNHSNPLFAYLKKLNKRKLFEAYNHWLFADGASAEAMAWKSTHPIEFSSFYDWFSSHPIHFSKKIPGPSVLFRKSGAFD